MADLLNLARMTVSGTPGAGTITLGAAVTGFLSFANAGAVNGAVYRYGIRDGNAREVGFGTYTASGTTLTRNLTKSTTGSLLSLTAAAIVTITPAAEDIMKFGFAANKGGTTQTNITSSAAIKVTMTNEAFDIGSFYDAPNSKWTPPAGLVSLSGQMQFIAGTSTAAFTQGDILRCMIFKNGALLANGIGEAENVNLLGISGFVQVAYVDKCNGADYYEFYTLVITAVAGDKQISGVATSTYWSGIVI